MFGFTYAVDASFVGIERLLSERLTLSEHACYVVSLSFGYFLTPHFFFLWASSVAIQFTLAAKMSLTDFLCCFVSPAVDQRVDERVEEN